VLVKGEPTKAKARWDWMKALARTNHGPPLLNP